MKQVIQLGVLSTINISINFIFQWYLLTQLGPGIETDAILAGMTLPQMVLAIASGALMHVLVPLLAGEDEQILCRDAWGFLFVLGGLFSLLAIILYVTASYWVPFIFPGFSDEGKILTVELTRIQIIGMVFSAVNSVQYAVYHARHKFMWVELTSMMASASCLLLLIFILPNFGVVEFAWISTLRIFLQTIFLSPGMGKPLKPDFRGASIQEFWTRIKPLLFGSMYYKTDLLVDRFLLSTASPGSLSLFYLAQQIYSAVMQVLNSAIAAPLVPLLSGLYKKKDIKKYQKTYHLKLLQVGFLSLVGLLIIGLFGRMILDVFVGYGNVTTENISKLWWFMIGLGGFFVGGSLGQISSSVFYSNGDTKRLVKVSMISYTAFIILKIAAFYSWGIWGLSVLISFYYITNFALQLYLLDRS